MAKKGKKSTSNASTVQSVRDVRLKRVAASVQTLKPIGQTGFQRRPVFEQNAVRVLEPDTVVSPVNDFAKRRVPAGTCKRRPVDTKSKGGNARPFIPYCSRKGK